MVIRACSLTTAIAICVFSAIPAQATVEKKALQPGHPEVYVVQPGDTLWSISEGFLQEPWRWRELMEANPEIRSPERLRVGDTIRIQISGATASARVGHGGGTPAVKLSPQVRETPLGTGIPTIPESVIAPFLTRPYVADKTTLDQSPYVVHFVGEHITGGTGDEVYARGIQDPDVTHYDIVRAGNPYEDPDSGEILGYEALYVGQARVERPGEIAKLRIREMELNTLVGDRLIALEPFELSDFYPEAAPKEAPGRIIGVLQGVSQIGLYDVVVLNRGKSDGLKPGSVYKVFQGGDEIRDSIASEHWRLDWPDPYAPSSQPPVVSWPEEDVRLPLEETGVLMVFRAFDRVSFALVMRASGPIHVLDRVRSPKV